MVRVMNKEHAPKCYELALRGAEGSIAVQGVEGHGPTATLTAPPGGVASHHVFVLLPRTAVTSEQSDLSLSLKDADTGTITTYDTIFRGPKR